MSTAILIFANTPEMETQSKRFTQSGKQSIEISIARHLNKKVATLCRTSGIDYYHINSSEQHGTGFAERFWNAYQSIFDKGYESVIGIGNDSPGLTSEILQVAQAKLRDGKIAIGPSEDGGVYLLGFARAQLSQEQFFAFKWKSGSLFTDLQQWIANENLAVHEFLTLIDIDCESDLRVSWLRNQSDIFFNLLISLIDSLMQAFRFELYHAKPIRVISSSSLKAPPVY